MFHHIYILLTVVCEELEFEKNVKFQKRPDEGRMKGIAFALDPDGYWIEIVSRHPASIVTNKYTFAQTMFRVKDAQKALFFYRDLLGMTLIRESHYSDFSLYFLAHVSKEEMVNVPKDPTSTEASDYIRCMFGPIIELTHNHGTEADPTFKYDATLAYVWSLLSSYHHRSSYQNRSSIIIIILPSLSIVIIILPSSSIIIIMTVSIHSS